MKKLKLILVAFGFLLSSAVISYDRNSVETVSDSPVKAIQSAIIKLNQLTATRTYSPQIIKFLVNQEISPLFDFKHIANEVLLASHIVLNEGESEFFKNTLKKNIINTLLAKLAQGNTGSFDFVSARPTIDGSIVVKLNAKGYSRFGLNIDLSFHRSQANKWQIYDVALEHDSLTSYYQRMILIKVRRYGIYGMLGRI
ncbi:hypothetical protein SPONN_246 [uncultured Candidatus Thioglobus sp.]|nr:hypothetical protein SPONN_246 [uncultured Candidatus Thioglobus sp.]